MRRWLAGVSVFLWAGAAFAADQPVIGPVPPWVEPVDVPEDVDPPGDAPVTTLLFDQQHRFDPAGNEAYVESYLRIDTSQGLSAVTTLGAEWQPAIQTVTFHKVHIIRDGEVIDLLANGQSFTILRRENNLEYAMLDGALTAVLQPEGLRVGDIVNLAYTTSGSDPVLGGAAQALVSGSGKAEHMHASAEWAEDRSVAWTNEGVFENAAEQRANGVVKVSVDLTDVEPFEAPPGAPARFLLGPIMQFSSFQSWEEISRLMAPLFAGASALPSGSALNAEIERIRTEHPDTRAQAEAALRLVQDQVRYLFLGMDEGRLVPATADETWSRRFGDCKGKTALLLALLHGLGIEAEAVLVNSLLGDALPEWLPMPAFDHVIVRAGIDGETYWLDGTRTGDRRLEDIQPPLFYWGLPLTAEGSGLVEIMPAPLAAPISEVTENRDYSAGLYVPGLVNGEMLARGDAATLLRRLAAAGTKAELDDAYRSAWAFYFPQSELDVLDGVYDDETGIFTMTASGDETGVWDDDQFRSNAGESLFAEPYEDENEARTAPYAVAFPGYSVQREVLILPYGGRGFEIEGGELSVASGAWELMRRATIEDGVATIETSARTLKAEMSVAELAEFKAAAQAARGDPIRVVAPDNYLPTDADFAVMSEGREDDPRIIAGRAAAMRERGDLDESVAILDQALQANPDAPELLDGRVLTHFQLGELDEAAEKLDRIREVAPDYPLLRSLEAQLAYLQGDEASPLALYDEMIEADPDNMELLIGRAQYYHFLGDDENALADSLEVTRIDPTQADAYMLRANIYDQTGQRYKALAEAEALAAAAPDSAYAHTVAGAIYAGFGDMESANSAFDRSLEIEPNEYAYLTRARYRPADERAAKRADVEAGLAVNPDSTDGIAMLSGILMDEGEYADVIPLMDRALQVAPGFGSFLIFRGIAYAKTGEDEQAEADFAAVRNLGGAAWLNNLCWERAIHRAALESVLEDCDAALEIEPGDAAFLDSRGMAYLQMGRFEEAIVDYDAALAARPDMDISLFGRGIAKLRFGDTAGGEADLAAARELDDGIDDQFAIYGLTP